MIWDDKELNYSVGGGEDEESRPATAKEIFEMLPLNLTITRQDESFYIVNDLDYNKQHVFYNVDDLVSFIERYE